MKQRSQERWPKAVIRFIRSSRTLDQFCKARCSESFGEGQSDRLLQPACCEATPFKLARLCPFASLPVKLQVVLTGVETLANLPWQPYVSFSIRIIRHPMTCNALEIGNPLQ